LVSVFLVNFNLVTMGLAVILVLLPLVVMRPNLYFLAFIILRPVMDIFSEFKLISDINLAAISTLFLVGLCGVMLLKKKAFRSIRNNRFLRVFNRLFLLFLAYCLFQIVHSPQKLTSLIDLIRLLSVFVAANYAAVYLNQEKKGGKLLWAILFSAIVPIGMGIYQFLFQRGMLELGYNRINGSFVHPNVFSQYLLLILFILFYLFNTRSLKLWQKFFVYPMLAIVIAELLLTFTRATWIALAISFMIFVFIKTAFSQKVKFFFIGAAIMISVFPFAQKRFSDIQDKKYYQLSSWQWRLKQWSETYESFLEHPFIGSGMGMHERDFKIMAHNDYLRIAYETGIFGLIFYASILFFILFFAFRQTQKEKVIAESNRYKIGLSIIASLMIMSMADNLARSTVVILYFFIACAYFLTPAPTSQIKDASTTGK